jgi:hypothetical protein
MNPRLAIAIISFTGFFPACGPVEEKAGPPAGTTFVAPPVEPRRNPNPSPEVHRWLEASASVRTQLAGLKEELAGLQQFHVTNHFDDFLAMDPAVLDAGQLTYLRHFLERGYFRIEREVLLQLLESRTARASNSQAPANGDIAGRLQSALHRDETLMIDLETAIARYRAPGQDPFQVPVVLTEAELTSLREKVTSLLGAERAKVAELDQKIRDLQNK